MNIKPKDYQKELLIKILKRINVKKKFIYIDARKKDEVDDVITFDNGSTLTTIGLKCGARGINPTGIVMYEWDCTKKT